MSYGQIRIIGGTLRGRRLKVPAIEGLRPTPDKVRETLFNWLQPMIAGAHCLDMFAGSGALGFEACSRGAAHIVMIDNAPEVIDMLRQEKNTFGVTNIEIYQADLPKQLRKAARPFDVVFLDPPYQSDLLLACCQFLEKMDFLAEQAYLYLESKVSLTAEMLPPNWEILKNKKTGQVSYHLVLRKGNEKG